MVEVVIYFVEKKNCEHIGNSIEWVVESTTSYHVIASKELFTTYKIKDFDTVKIVHHFLVNWRVKIGDMYIKLMPVAQWYSRMHDMFCLRLNILSTLAKDQVGNCNHIYCARGHVCCNITWLMWRLVKSVMRSKTLWRLHSWELRLIVLLSRVKFFLLDSATNEGQICDDKYRDVKPTTIDNDDVKDFQGLE